EEEGRALQVVGLLVEVDAIGAFPARFAHARGVRRIRGPRTQTDRGSAGIGARFLRRGRPGGLGGRSGGSERGSRGRRRGDRRLAGPFRRDSTDDLVGRLLLELPRLRWVVLRKVAVPPRLLLREELHDAFEVRAPVPGDLLRGLRALPRVGLRELPGRRNLVAD